MAMRLGLFGGTFNPVHHGHLEAARAALETLALDRLLFIPSGHPPLKGNAGLVPGQHRSAMIELAIGAEPRFGLCNYEIERTGPSYSVDTVRRIVAETGPDAQLIFLIGSDCADRLSRWKGIAEINALARFAIIARNGDGLSGVAATMLTVPMASNPASSTAVRAALAGGRSAAEFIDVRVLNYAREHRLYSETADA
jgi:nicotinate-nucleotide adenylyltransferase